MESRAVYLEDVDATDILQTAAWFRTWLKERGVVIHPESEMARGLARLEEYGRRVVAMSATRLQRAEARSLYRDALGWNFLIRAIHLAGDALCDEFEKYGGWQKLTGKDVVLSREAEHSQMRDVLFELCAAAACSTFATDVRLEDPPDVTLTFGGVRRGIACKVFYSPDQGRHEDALVAGAKQLNSFA